MAGYNLGTATGRIDIDQGGLQGAVTGLRQTGFALTAIGTGLVGAVGAVIMTAADFESSMSAISAITGETGSNLDKLREEALRLGKEGPYGPREVAEAFIELGKAGLTTQEILDGVGEATVNLAAAGDLALDRAGEILSNTIRTFRLTADEAGHVADVLAGAANASTIDVEDLAVSLKYAGSVAETVGISFEDTANALVVLGNAGIKGSTGGTSLRRILLNLSPASEKARGTLEELGIITEDGANKFYTAEGRAKSLGEIFDILRDATAGMSDEQKVAALNTVFGARAVSSALILLKEGSEGLAAANEMVNRTTAGEVAEKRLDNLAGSIQKLKAALEAVFIEAGTPFQSFLKGVVDGIRQLVLWFGELPQPLQTVLIAITGIVGVLALVGGAFFLILAPALQLIYLLSVLPGSLTILRTALSGVTTAVRAFTVSLLTNPIFLIAAAIAAVIAALVLLYFHWQPMRDFVDGLWQGIQKVWDEVLTFFGGLPAKLGAAYESTKSILGDLFGWIKDNWAGVLLTLVAPQIGIPKLIVDNWDGINQKVEEAGEVVDRFKEKVGPPLAQQVIETTASIQGSFQGMQLGTGISLKMAEQDVRNWGTNTAIEGKNKADEFRQSVTLAYQMLPGMVGYNLGLVVGETLKSLGMVASAAYAQGQQFMLNAALWFSQLPQEMQRWLFETVMAVYTYGPQVVAMADQMGQQVLFNLAMTVGTLPQRFGEWLLGAALALASYAPSMFRSALQIGTQIYLGIMNGVAGVPAMMGDIMVRAVNAITGMISKAAKAARDFASGVWNGIKKGLGINSPSYVEEAFWAMERNVGTALDNMFSEVAGLSKLKNLQSTLNVASLPYSPAARISDDSSRTSEASGNTYIDLDVINPQGEPTEDSIHREMQKLAVHGLLPPLTEGV